MKKEVFGTRPFNGISMPIKPLLNVLSPCRKSPAHYRYAGQLHLAYLFAQQGSRIPYPKEHLLFVQYPVYDYQFDEELSIVAYYTPYKEEGLASANRLILNRSAPSAC